MFGLGTLDRDLDMETRGGTVLLRNEAGTQADAFLAHAAAHHSQEGGQVLYLLTDRPVNAVRRHLAAVEADLDHVSFLDGHGTRSGFPDPSAEPLDLTDMDGLPGALDAARTRSKDPLLIIDSLSGLMDAVGTKAVLDHWKPLTTAIQAYPEALVRYLDLGEEPVIEKALAGFPSEVRLLSVQERILRHQYWRVDRSHGKKVAKPRQRLFRTSPTGDVYLYVPKLLVTGAQNAGKTTFIQSVSDRAVGTDYAGTTVAMDRGHVVLDDSTIELYGTPGQERFDPLLDVLGDQAVAIVVMVDATEPESIDRAAQMLERVWHRGVSVVVLANKVDRKGAMRPVDVADALKAKGHDVPVMPCVATDRDIAKETLMDIIDLLLYGGEE